MTERSNALPGSLKLRESKGYHKQKVKEMVQTYRKNADPKDSLHYSHFNAYDVLQLFIANGVLSESVAKAIEAEQGSITAFGLKIYLGTHCFPLTPPYPGPIDPSKYLGKTTTILCSTKIKTDGNHKEFWDLLDDKGTMGLVGEDVGPGQGLDQSEIAPPYTVTTPDPDGEQDVNDAP